MIMIMIGIKLLNLSYDYDYDCTQITKLKFDPRLIMYPRIILRKVSCPCGLEDKLKCMYCILRKCVKVVEEPKSLWQTSTY